MRYWVRMGRWVGMQVVSLISRVSVCEDDEADMTSFDTSDFGYTACTPARAGD
jgi:hypothetical protein